MSAAKACVLGSVLLAYADSQAVDAGPDGASVGQFGRIGGMHAGSIGPTFGRARGRMVGGSKGIGPAWTWPADEDDEEDEDAPEAPALIGGMHAGSIGPAFYGQGRGHARGRLGAVGPAWTWGGAEKPAGIEDMAGWTKSVYTEEQQARLGVDKNGEKDPLMEAEDTEAEEALLNIMDIDYSSAVIDGAAPALLGGMNAGSIGPVFGQLFGGQLFGGRGGYTGGYGRGSQGGFGRGFMGGLGHGFMGGLGRGFTGGHGLHGYGRGGLIGSGAFGRVGGMHPGSIVSAFVEAVVDAEEEVEEVEEAVESLVEEAAEEDR